MGDFDYQEEKFVLGRKMLLLRRNTDYSTELSHAFDEFGVALAELDRTELTDFSLHLVQQLEKFMFSPDIDDPDNLGQWKKKVQKASDEELYALAGTIDELTNWFIRINDG